MKKINANVVLVVIWLAGISLYGQQTFQNLDFESGNLSNATPFPPMAPIAQALPGWSASINGVPVTQVLANLYTTGQASLDVFGPGWNSTQPGVIDGNYTVFLQAFNPGQGNVTLSQTGMIPASAKSLQFSAWQDASANESFSVSFAGTSLSPVLLSSTQSPSGQPYNIYGIDIAAYEGQTGQLAFTANSANGLDWVEFDDIAFSSVAVTPEPDTLALMVMGGLALGARRWYSRK